MKPVCETWTPSLVRVVGTSNLMNRYSGKWLDGAVLGSFAVKVTKAELSKPETVFRAWRLQYFIQDYVAA
jgi:hypothetical protein